MEAFTFRELKKDPQPFFEILPQDWQDEIVPFWNDYKPNAKIYCIEYKKTIIGGGIVFYKAPPHFKYFENEAKDWFNQGYLYLGFIWVDEDKRNKNLGTFWLNQLKLQDSQQKYFLLTEEEHLHRFYTKNGFVCKQTVENQGHWEWLFHTTDNSDKKLF